MSEQRRNGRGAAPRAGKGTAQGATGGGATPSGATAPGAQPSGWSRARQRLAEAGSGVGSAVTSKVDEARSNIARNTSAEQVEASRMVPGAARTAPSQAPTAQVTRRTRKARLRLARLDPWSVFKTVLLFAVAGGIIFFIATWVVWGVINASGVFSAVNKAVNDLVASPGSTTTFRLEDYVNTHRVLGFAALIAVLDAILFTALATLFSFLYNLAATVMGGLEVTLAED